MIISDTFISNWLRYRNTNIIVHGKYISYILDYLNSDRFNKVNDKDITYQYLNSIFIFNFNKKFNNNLIDKLKEVCSSINYYDENFKNIFILLNFSMLNTKYKRIIKTIINNSYETSIFMIHTDNLCSLDKNFYGQFLVLHLPYMPTINDKTIDITYNKIIKLVKQSLSTEVIEKMKEISYYYYIAHKDSIDLQRYIVKEIGNNNYLPNKIKMNIVKDIAELNHLYQHSYRKPIFLEGMIMCLFKHLENYTTNL